ncbi:MAG TPA: SagB/ThcOx family dehydrogenase [bacterium]|nr:SagB/ThcOx family dehydrogenase [bacterium]
MIKMEIIHLPEPLLKGRISVEEALYTRHSTRSFSTDALIIQEVSQILWAAYGRNAYGKKTVPSAGASYPFDIYLVAGDIIGLKSGLYQYDSENHDLITIRNIDIRKAIAEAAYGQMFVCYAPAIIILVARFARTTRFYGKRGERYVFIDSGHIGQNISLQVEAIGLAACMVGAFDDEKISEILSVKGDTVYIIPVGREKA